MPRANRKTPPASLEELGRALRQLRGEKGLKQIEVSAGAGVTESQISEIERGLLDARWTTVLRILEGGLDASVADLANAIDDRDE